MSHSMGGGPDQVSTATTGSDCPLPKYKESYFPREALNEESRRSLHMTYSMAPTEPRPQPSTLGGSPLGQGTGHTPYLGTSPMSDTVQQQSMSDRNPNFFPHTPTTGTSQSSHTSPGTPPPITSRSPLRVLDIQHPPLIDASFVQSMDYMPFSGRPVAPLVQYPKLATSPIMADMAHRTTFGRRPGAPAGTQNPTTSGGTMRMDMAPITAISGSRGVATTQHTFSTTSKVSTVPPVFTVPPVMIFTTTPLAELPTTTTGAAAAPMVQISPSLPACASTSAATTQGIGTPPKTQKPRPISKWKKLLKHHGPCAVCHEDASGEHYRALTCEGCKGFFKRTVQQMKNTGLLEVTYICKHQKNCSVIGVVARKLCRYCRYFKCISSKMKTEAVMGPAARSKLKSLKKSNKVIKLLQEQHSSNLTKEETKLYNEIMAIFNEIRQDPAMEVGDNQLPHLSPQYWDVLYWDVQICIRFALELMITFGPEASNEFMHYKIQQHADKMVVVWILGTCQLSDPNGSNEGTMEVDASPGECSIEAGPSQKGGTKGVKKGSPKRCSKKKTPAKPNPVSKEEEKEKEVSICFGGSKRFQEKEIQMDGFPADMRNVCKPFFDMVTGPSRRTAGLEEDDLIVLKLAIVFLTGEGDTAVVEEYDQLVLKLMIILMKLTKQRAKASPQKASRLQRHKTNCVLNVMAGVGQWRKTVDSYRAFTACTSDILVKWVRV
ncbi:hypothetical protein ACOMHN_020954 [Nucella lapillus]